MPELTEAQRYKLAQGCRDLAAQFATLGGVGAPPVKFPGWDYENGIKEINDSIRAAAYSIYNGDTSYDDYTEVPLQDLARLLRYVGDMVDFM